MSPSPVERAYAALRTDPALMEPPMLARDLHRPAEPERVAEPASAPIAEPAIGLPELMAELATIIKEREARTVAKLQSTIDGLRARIEALEEQATRP